MWLVARCSQKHQWAGPLVISVSYAKVPRCAAATRRSVSALLPARHLLQVQREETVTMESGKESAPSLRKPPASRQSSARGAPTTIPFRLWYARGKQSPTLMKWKFRP